MSRMQDEIDRSATAPYAGIELASVKVVEFPAAVAV